MKRGRAAGGRHDRGGSPNSSNSQRLREVAERAGCPVARLVLRAARYRLGVFAAIRRLGITAGASAPGGAGRGDHRRLRGALRRGVGDASRPPTRACSSPCRGPARRGGGVGRWRSTPRCPTRSSPPSSPATTSARLAAKGIAEGVENSNYLLHTERGFYILTLYEKRVRERPALLPRPDAAPARSAASTARCRCATATARRSAGWPAGPPRS